MTTTKKITKATFKSFIRKNADQLHVCTLSTFDGMIDGVRSVAGRFAPAQINPASQSTNTLGVQGVWLTNGRGTGSDYFSAFEGDGFTGIKVRNCCGSFIVAIPA